MFEVYSSFSELPDVAVDETLAYCSFESNIFVYLNNRWIDYETFVDGYTSIVKTTLSEDISVNSEEALFSEAPIYDYYKTLFYYPIIFSANKIESVNQEPFIVNIISNTGFTLGTFSGQTMINPSFRLFYKVNQDNPESVNSPEGRTYSTMFNVEATNAKFTGPVTLELFKPIGA